MESNEKGKEEINFMLMTVAIRDKNQARDIMLHEVSQRMKDKHRMI